MDGGDGAVLWHQMDLLNAETNHSLQEESIAHLAM